MSTIIAANPAGLGNRIKAIVSAMRITPQAKVYWPRQADKFNCGYSEIFTDKRDIEPPFPEGSLYYTTQRLLVLDKDEIPNWFSKTESRSPEVLPDDGNANGRNIDLEYNRIPQSVRDTYVDLFNRLRIDQAIIDRANQFAQRFSQNTVSLHVRSWRDEGTRNRYLFQMERYVAEVDALIAKNPYTDFYLATDNPQVTEFMAKRYPNRMHIFHRGSSLIDSRTSPEGLRDDMVELLLLSKNNLIIGAHLSTFTEVAWWLGGAKARVVIL